MAVFEEESQLFQGSAYRDHLNKNWEAGNKKFAELEKKIEGQKPQGSADAVSQESVSELNKKINRIILGVDHETIKTVVFEILKDEGVI